MLQTVQSGGFFLVFHGTATPWNHLAEVMHSGDALAPERHFFPLGTYSTVVSPLSAALDIFLYSSTSS